MLIDSYVEHRDDELITRMQLAGIKVPDAMLDREEAAPQQEVEAFATPTLDAIDREDIAARIARMQQEPAGKNLATAFQG